MSDRNLVEGFESIFEEHWAMHKKDKARIAELEGVIEYALTYMSASAWEEDLVAGTAPQWVVDFLESIAVKLREVFKGEGAE